MKKLLGTIVGLVLIAGCGAPTSTAPAASEPVETAAATQAAPAADRDFAVVIEGSTQVKDYQGKPALVVDFTFTNNSDKAATFLVSVSAKAFQDGVQLESAMIMDSTTYDSGSSMKELKPGASLAVQNAYLLSGTSDVEIEVTESFNFTNKEPLATKTITLS